MQRYKPDIIFSDGEWDRDSQSGKVNGSSGYIMSQTLLKTLLLMIVGGETRFKRRILSTDMTFIRTDTTKNLLTVDGKNAGAWVNLWLIEMKSQKTTALRS